MNDSTDDSKDDKKIILIYFGTKYNNHIPNMRYIFSIHKKILYKELSKYFKIFIKEFIPFYEDINTFEKYIDQDL